VYLKKSELILRAIGSAGGRAKTEPPFRPPRLEAETKRTISSMSCKFLESDNTTFLACSVTQDKISFACSGLNSQGYYLYQLKLRFQPLEKSCLATYR